MNRRSRSLCTSRKKSGTIGSAIANASRMGTRAGANNRMALVFTLERPTSHYRSRRPPLRPYGKTATSHLSGYCGGPAG